MCFVCKDEDTKNHSTVCYCTFNKTLLNVVKNVHRIMATCFICSIIIITNFAPYYWPLRTDLSKCESIIPEYLKRLN